MTNIWLKFDIRNTKTKTDLEEPLKRLIKYIYKEVQNTIDAGFESKSIKSPYELPAELFDIKAANKYIDKNAAPHLKSLIKDSIKSTLGMLAVDIPMSSFAQDIAEALAKSTGKIKISMNTINNEIRRSIQGIISEYPLASEAELRGKINGKLEGKFTKEYPQSRVKTIARTSSTFANGSAQTATMDKAGYKAVWLSSRDADVRLEHREADGQKRSEAGLFEVGGESMPYPAAGMLPSNNINCRCVLRPAGK